MAAEGRYVADRIIRIRFDDKKILKYRLPVYEYNDKDAQEAWQKEADRAAQALFEDKRDNGMKCGTGLVKAVEIVSDRVIKI